VIRIKSYIAYIGALIAFMAFFQTAIYAKPPEGNLSEAIFLWQCIDSEWRDKVVYEKLIEATKDKYSRASYRVERAAVLRTKLEKDGELCVVPLGRFLKADDVNVRLWVVREASRLFSKRREASVLLVFLLNDQNNKVRLATAELLGQLGARGKTFLPYLAVNLSSNNKKLGEACAGSIAKIAELKVSPQGSPSSKSQTMDAVKTWVENTYGSIKESSFPREDITLKSTAQIQEAYYLRRCIDETWKVNATYTKLMAVAENRYFRAAYNTERLVALIKARALVDKKMKKFIVALEKEYIDISQSEELFLLLPYAMHINSYDPMVQDIIGFYLSGSKNLAAFPLCVSLLYRKSDIYDIILRRLRENKIGERPAIRMLPFIFVMFATTDSESRKLLLSLKLLEIVGLYTRKNLPEGAVAISHAAKWAEGYYGKQIEKIKSIQPNAKRIREKVISHWETLAAHPTPQKSRPIRLQKLRLGVPDGFKAVDGTVAEPYTNTNWAKEIIHITTGIEMVFIPAGEFKMGNKMFYMPVHTVQLTHPFYMAKYETTQKQWARIMDVQCSKFAGADNPVDNVSWYLCQAFLKRAGNALRLPTEAEWEYACRAGTNTRYHFGSDEDMLNNYAWTKENSDEKTHKVGQKLPNAWNLYDVCGNVNEWCSDWFSRDYYNDSPKQNPKGPNTGRNRVLRGGSWESVNITCWSSDRQRFGPTAGFRVVKGL